MVNYRNQKSKRKLDFVNVCYSWKREARDFIPKRNLFRLGKKYFKEECLGEGSGNKVHLTTFFFIFVMGPGKQNSDLGAENKFDGKFLALGSTEGFGCERQRNGHYGIE